MGDFSRDTFDKLKHYVGVRLQQGVPLVDADWNEQEDIRKYELRTFLKWFIGNGVPKGNDGFRIMPVENKIILTSKTTVGKSSLKINWEKSEEAARVLGFDEDNCQALRIAPPVAQLIGTKSGPYHFNERASLFIAVDDADEKEILFDRLDYETAQDVIDVINTKVGRLASVGGDNDFVDFVIRGGDGTPEGAGRCLVEGWDVINECDLLYSQQGLDPINIPTSRTDLVYLDVWEREVTSTEDESLVNKSIGLETCVRLKREWVVRIIAQGKTQDKLSAPPPDHVYYPLALLTWKGQRAIRQEDITDLRQTGLSIMTAQNDIRQITRDAYGPSYTLDHDGQPNLKMSLREAINALLRGGMPCTPEKQLTTDEKFDALPFALEDKDGDIWVFWVAERPGNDDSGNDDMKYTDIRCIRYSQAWGRWGKDTQLSTDTAGYRITPSAIVDKDGDIWVFWVSERTGDGDSEHTDIRYTRHRHSQADNNWEEDTLLTTDAAEYRIPSAIVDNEGDIWVFWVSKRTVNGDSKHTTDIRYTRHRHSQADNNWEEDTSLTTGVFWPTPLMTENSFSVIVDNEGNIWVFWVSERTGDDNSKYIIKYNRHSQANNQANNGWGDDTQLITDTTNVLSPSAIVDNGGDIWVFWVSERTGDDNSKYTDIKYNRHSQANNKWMTKEIQLPTDTAGASTPSAIVDNEGDIWVFWVLDRGKNPDILYTRYTLSYGWSCRSQLTTGLDMDATPVAVKGRDGDIWIFWTKIRWGTDDNVASSEIWYKKLISTI